MTTCEKELAKIKAKAQKRHEQYLKYKTTHPIAKIPLKRDIIASLQKEIEELKRQIPVESPHEEAPLLLDEVYEYNEEVVAEQLTVFPKRLEEQENPLKKGEKCSCVGDLYTLDKILEKIEKEEWKNKTIKAFMIHSINTFFTLIEKEYLPSCIKCLEKVTKNLDNVETDKQKKKMYIQAVILLIKKLEIPLNNDVIEKYISIYTHYKAE